MDIRKNMDVSSVNTEVDKNTYQHLLNDMQRIIDDARKRAYKEIFHAVSGKSTVMLSWTHYRTLNPTLGIILCADTDDDIARYSVLHDNDHLFASKYLTYLPTKEQLRIEIERQKQLFYLQQAENKEDNE